MGKQSEKRIRNRNDKQVILFCILCFAAVFFIVIYQLCNKAQIFGHDAWYHIIRIEALKTQILDGNPFSRINYYFNQGIGYASSLCYPDWSLYIPAFLRVFGVSINVSYNIFLMILGVSCYFTTFYAANKMTGDKCASSVCAALFTLCQYHLDCILTRGALGEIQAFIFIPLAVYGLYDYFYNGFSHPAVMGVGFAGLILSHTITTVLIAIVYIIVFLIRIPEVIKAPKKLVKLLTTAGLVALVTAYYWIPLLEIMGRMDLKVSHFARKVSDTGIELSDLFADIKMDTKNHLGLGVSIFVLVILRFTVRRSELKNGKNGKDYNILRCADAFAVIGVISAFASTKYFPWTLLDNTPLKSIQFAWRLYIIASVFMCFASAAYAYIFVKGSKTNGIAVYTAIGVIVCLLGFVHTRTANPSYKYREPDYFSDTSMYNDELDNTCRLGGAEWFPYEATKNKNEAIMQSNTVKDAKGRQYSFDKKGTEVTVALDGSQSGDIQIPLICYIGYKAEFTPNGGKTQDIDIYMNNRLGLIMAKAPQSAGTLKVYYEGTALQKISLGLTVLTVIGLAALFIYNKNKKPSPAE